MMQGTVGEAFDLPWGVTISLENYSGSVRAGDTLIVGDHKWRISGIPHIKRVELPANPNISVTLADASIAELKALFGQPFETTSDIKPST
jgi:hypothetical protein